MTIRSALVLAALLPACLDSGGYGFDSVDPPPFNPEEPPPPPPPPPPECTDPQGCEPIFDPFSFSYIGPVTQGIGLAFDLPVNVGLAGYELTSTDPTIVDVEVEGGKLHVHALTPGSATIEARRAGDTRVVDSIVVFARVVDRADVLVRATAISPEPLAAIAAVPGSDSIGIVYRSAGNERLEGRGAFTGTGTVSVLPGFGFELVSEIFEWRESVRLTFTAPGAGTLEIDIGGDRVQSLPIEVLGPAAASSTTLELVPLVVREGHVVLAPDAVETGEIMGVDLVARTADGRFVAAVRGAWTAPTPEPPPSDVIEIVFDAPTTAGPFEVTATTGGRTVARTFLAE